ncbi:hypothetical protein ACWGST_16300 [Agromyces sp. NPDC055520]
MPSDRARAVPSSVGYWGFAVPAFEIIVFALIFGWITVFSRFLGVVEQPA